MCDRVCVGVGIKKLGGLGGPRGKLPEWGLLAKSTLIYNLHSPSLFDFILCFGEVKHFCA